MLLLEGMLEDVMVPTTTNVIMLGVNVPPLSDNVFISENTSSGDTSLLQYFTWCHVKHNAFELTWNIKKLTEKRIDEITVTANPRFLPYHTMFRSSKVETGSITIDGLLNHTEYVLITQALRGEYGDLQFTVNVRTGPTGKFY